MYCLLLGRNEISDVKQIAVPTICIDRSNIFTIFISETCYKMAVAYVILHLNIWVQNRYFLYTKTNILILLINV